MAIRSIVTVLAATLLLVSAVPASAQQAKCLVGKTKCMNKKAGGLLKCHQKAESPGKPADPNAGDCVTKVVTKFDGGADAAKGCFEKLENKSGNDCISFDDTASAEAAVDSCVDTLVDAIDPPPISQTKCGVGKKKCVAKLLASVLKCNEKAQTPGKPTDPNTDGCVDKATAKYTGGLEPAKGCFAKLEAKDGNDCQVTNDSATLQGLVTTCVADLVDLVSNPPATTTTTAAPTTSTTGATTTTTSSTTTTTIGGGSVLLGVLPSTSGLFNFTPAQPGLPGADTRCNVEFAGTHHCTHAELLSAETAGDLVGIQDINGMTVTSFWLIDASHPNTDQCNLTAGGPAVRWQYATVHTGVGGERVALTNGTGDLGGTTGGLICFQSSWVGCCQ